MHPRFSPDANRPSNAPGQPTPMAALEDLAKALVHEGQHLILYSGSRAALARAEQSLQTCWPTLAPQALVLHFSAREPWAWLSHLNDQVSRHMPGNAQVSTPGLVRRRPEAIAVLHQAEQLSSSDMALLQGLTQHLPDWGTRWVLLCQQPSTAALGSAASPRWLSWRVGDEADDLPSPESAPPASALNASVKPTSTHAPRPAGGWAQSLWWPVSVLVFSAGAWGLASGRISLSELPPQWLRQLAAQPNAAQPVASTSSAAQAAPTPAPTETTPPDDNAPAAQAAASEGSSAESQAPSADAAPPAPDVAPPPLPDVALRGARWLAQQSPDHFVLEHGIFDSAAQAQSLIRSRAELRNARILMHKPGQPHAGRFGVITGPFRSSERAQNYIARENLPLQIPVRSVASVLQDIVTRP